MTKKKCYKIIILILLAGLFFLTGWRLLRAPAAANEAIVVTRTAPLLPPSPPAAEAAAPQQPDPLAEANLINLQMLSSMRLYFDIRYATENNFTGKKIYSSPACYLHQSTLEALAKAYDALQNLPEPLTFIIYDCYRPQSEHKKLWDAYPNPRYLARPEKGSRHSRGTAVDLTLASMDGAPLKMPTEFDSFSEEAHMDNDNIPQEEKKNRELLKKIMTEAGFTYTRTEWWHFDGPAARTPPLLDIPLP